MHFYLSLRFFTTSACLLDFIFVAIMTSQYYKNHLLNQLYNLRQGHISTQNYIAIFENLTFSSDAGEHRSQTITRFVWGLRSKIKCVIIIGSYALDTVEEAFDIALK